MESNIFKYVTQWFHDSDAVHGFCVCYRGHMNLGDVLDWMKLCF